MISANDYETTAAFLGDGPHPWDQSLRSTFSMIDAILRQCLYSQPRPDYCSVDVDAAHVEEVIVELTRLRYRVSVIGGPSPTESTININLKEFRT